MKFLVVLRWVVCAALLASVALPLTAAAEATAVVNAIRRQGCDRMPGQNAALQPDPKLDRAASGVAGGQRLRQAIADAGYRAVESVVIEVHGTASDAELARLIRQSFCAQVVQAGLQHIGVFRRGGRGAEDHWIVLAAPFTVPTLDARTVVQRMLVLVNEARAAPRQCGSREFGAAPPVRWAPRLEQAAAAHARDMAARQVLSHTGGDGSRARDRVERTGYTWRALGENVAAGQRTAEDAVASWLRSPGHCANLMNADFAEMGVGFATNIASEPGIFWTQVFAAPDDDAQPRGAGAPRRVQRRS